MATRKNEQSKKIEETFRSKRLYRSEIDKVIAGVAGGLGEYFDIDPNIIRVVFVLITIFGGSGILVYLALWIILPSHATTVTNETNIRNNAQEIKTKAEAFAQEIRGA